MPWSLQSLPFDPPGGWERCIRVLLRRPHAVLFDSALAGDLGRHSFLSFGPSMLLTCNGDAVGWTHDDHTTQSRDDPLHAFERLEHAVAGGVAGDADAGFYGGWAGLLGFDLRVFIESLPPPKPGGPRFPDLLAGFYPWTLAHDHATGATELRHLLGAPGALQDVTQVAHGLEGILRSEPEAVPAQLSEPELSTSREDYLLQVAAIKRHIFEGDVYQANLTREVVRHGHADPVRLYSGLRTANAAPFGGFLDCGDGRYVLSSSPERFLSVRDGLVETRPIKGTRPRGSTAAEDARLRDELQHSEKDRAELTMIVDLERNDLSRVCEPGSVKVPSLMRAQTYARVHHLEATVQGRLRGGTTPAALIRATFPGGSITGVPKKRALEIIHELEPVRRGPYTGSMFYLTPDFRFESNILIRTLLLEPGRVSYHVGGGIVADSEPDSEWDETIAKAAALESALETA
jgi:para-aminobenzoate synthetase component 1